MIEPTISPGATCRASTSSSPASAPTSAATDLRANNQRLLEYVEERRHADRPVQQVRVQPGAVRPVSGQGQHQPRHRRDGAGEGPRAGRIRCSRRPIGSTSGRGSDWVQERGLYFLGETRSEIRRSRRDRRPVPIQRRAEARRAGRSARGQRPMDLRRPEPVAAAACRDRRRVPNCSRTCWHSARPRKPRRPGRPVSRPWISRSGTPGIWRGRPRVV